MNNKIFKIFIDFDGTITRQDVGAAFVNHFGNPKRVDEIVQDWIENKISSPESWYLMFDTLRKFTHDEFLEFLNTIEIDNTFSKFVEYCRENNFEIRILSDGFDLYINEILKRENLPDLEIYCNRAIVKDTRELIPEFPYGDEECKFCGNCKRNQILVNSADDDYILYVGDGYSDKCPIQYCDFIFAKNDLLKYCEVNRITYFPYNDFNDVKKKLNELKQKKRLKKRHQAELKRKEIFMQG